MRSAAVGFVTALSLCAIAAVAFWPGAIPAEQPAATTTPAVAESPETSQLIEPSATSATLPPTTEGPSPEIPPVVVLASEPPSFGSALDFSRALRAELPSDCLFDLDAVESLPNAPRTYRNGTHQGIDFICGDWGRFAVAALPGRVAAVVRDFEEPAPTDRNELLSVAEEIGYTPPWLLTTLYGNFVVVDHGKIEGVGHVVSLYAHLETVFPEIKAGALVAGGDPLGLVGNSGTATAAANGSRPQSIHLHWEIHIDGVYLGAGLSPAETRSVYEELFVD